MDPITFAVLGVVAGSVGLKWLESTLSKTKKPVEIEAKPEKDEHDLALACPYYFTRDYEDRAIEAGIMDEEERNLCDDCEYCNGIRSHRKEEHWRKLHAQQEADRVLAARRQKELSLKRETRIQNKMDAYSRNKSISRMDFVPVYDPVFRRYVMTPKTKPRARYYDLGPN